MAKRFQCYLIANFTEDLDGRQAVVEFFTLEQFQQGPYLVSFITY